MDQETETERSKRLAKVQNRTPPSIYRTDRPTCHALVVEKRRLTGAERRTAATFAERTKSLSSATARCTDFTKITTSRFRGGQRQLGRGVWGDSWGAGDGWAVINSAGIRLQGGLASQVCFEVHVEVWWVGVA